MPVIPEFWKLSQEDCKFQATLIYRERPDTKQTNKKNG
jgi:hypothetical protein